MIDIKEGQVWRLKKGSAQSACVVESVTENGVYLRAPRFAGGKAWMDLEVFRSKYKYVGFPVAGPTTASPLPFS